MRVVNKSMVWVIVLNLVGFQLEAQFRAEDYVYKILLKNCDNSNLHPRIDNKRVAESYNQAVGFKLRDTNYILTVAHLFVGCKRNFDKKNLLDNLLVYSHKRRAPINIHNIEIDMVKDQAKLFLYEPEHTRLINKGFVQRELEVGEIDRIIYDKFQASVMSFNYGLESSTFPVFDPVSCSYQYFNNRDKIDRAWYVHIPERLGKGTSGSPLISTKRLSDYKFEQTNSVFGMVHFRPLNTELKKTIALSTSQSHSSDYLKSGDYDAISSNSQPNYVFANIDKVKKKMRFRSAVYKALIYIKENSIEQDFYNLYRNNFALDQHYETVIPAKEVSIRVPGVTPGVKKLDKTKQNKRYYKLLKKYPFIMDLILVYTRYYHIENRESKYFDLTFFKDKYLTDAVTKKDKKMMKRAKYPYELLEKRMKELKDYSESRLIYAKADSANREGDCKTAVAYISSLKTTKYGGSAEVNKLLTNSIKDCITSFADCINEVDALSKEEPCNPKVYANLLDCYKFSVTKTDSTLVSSGLREARQDCNESCRDRISQLKKKLKFAFRKIQKEIGADFGINMTYAGENIEVDFGKEETCEKVRIKFVSDTKDSRYTEIRNFINSLEVNAKRFNFQLGEYSNLEARMLAFTIQKFMMSLNGVLSEEPEKNRSTPKESFRSVTITASADATPFRGKFKYKHEDSYGDIESELRSIRRKKGWRKDYQNYRLAAARALAFKYYLQEEGYEMFNDSNINIKPIVSGERGGEYRYVEFSIDSDFKYLAFKSL